MKWSFDDRREWEALSAINDGGDHFIYHIRVCDDGTFDVSHSDAELGLKETKCVSTFRQAVELCEKKERELVTAALAAKLEFSTWLRRL